MECLWEKMVKLAGFRLIHDGQYEEEQLFYTRVYRLGLDGELVNTWLRFKYDLRTGYADVSISWEDLAEWEKLTEGELCGAILEPTL